MSECAPTQRVCLPDRNRVERLSLPAVTDVVYLLSYSVTYLTTVGMVGLTNVTAKPVSTLCE